MALSDLDVKQVFTGNGVTTTFAIPFAFDSADTSTVKVYLRDESVDPATETLQTIGGGNDYTIVGTNVVMNTAPTSDEKLIIIRVTPLTQTFDPLTTSRIDVDALEEEMDKIVKQVQELDERMDRAMLLQLGTSASGLTIPEPSADTFLKWNSAGTNLENSDAITDQDLFTTDAVTFLDVTISSLTASRPVKSDANKKLTSGQINIASSNDITGTLAIANGGTGQTTDTAAFDALGPGTTKGDLIVHDGTNHVRVAVGNDGEVLKADSAAPAGVAWDTSADATLTTKGDLFTYDTGNVRLPLGTNGYILKVNTSTSTGLEWVAANTVGADPLTTKGDLFTFDTDAARLAVGTNGYYLKANSATTTGLEWAALSVDLTTEVTGALPIANGGTGQTSQTAAFDALAPTTTKGDLIAHNGTDNVRLAGSGTDGFVLTYDSAEATGIKWAAAAGGGGGGLSWFNDDGDAPVEQVKYNNKVWTFSDGLSQNLYTTVKVPQGYIAGNPIKMFITHFHEAASATQLLSAQATLIKPGEAFDSTTNQRTTTNTAQTGASKITIEAELDIASATGQINSVAVAAGDLIRVRLYRGTDTSTSDVHFIESSTEVTFS